MVQKGRRLGGMVVSPPGYARSRKVRQAWLNNSVVRPCMANGLFPDNEDDGDPRDLYSSVSFTSLNVNAVPPRSTTRTRIWIINNNLRVRGLLTSALLDGPWLIRVYIRWKRF